jgi:hypothetical protein
MILNAVSNGKPQLGSEEAYETDQRQMLTLLRAIYGQEVPEITNRSCLRPDGTVDTDQIRAIYDTVQHDTGMAAVIVGTYDQKDGFPPKEALAELVQQLPVPILIEVRNFNTEIGEMLIESEEAEKTVPLYPIGYFATATEEGRLVIITPFY